MGRQCSGWGRQFLPSSVREQCPPCGRFHPGDRLHLQSPNTHPPSECACPACVLLGRERQGEGQGEGKGRRGRREERKGGRDRYYVGSGDEREDHDNLLLH